MRSLKLHAPSQPPPELSAAEAAELSPAESHAAERVAAAASGPDRLGLTHSSQQAANVAVADSDSDEDDDDDQDDGEARDGSDGDQSPRKALKTSSTAVEASHQEALSGMRADAEARRGSRDGQTFATCGSGATQIGRSRQTDQSSPAQAASLESVSPSFSLSSSSSSSSSSSPSSSSSSALSSSSSTNIPAINGVNNNSNKQLALNGNGGGLASSGGGGGSSSSSGNSSSSSGHGSHSSSSSSSNSNMTAFLSKLWRMVNDSHNDDQIRWSQSGCSFVIINQIQFAKDMLPIYFKHSNMASFIRQLNMYGFRKIPLMSANKSGDQRADVAQFYHVNFMRGQEQRLSSIKRKNNSGRTQNLVVNGSFCDEVRAILRDVKSIRDGQNSSESILGALQLDNKSLWRDVAILRSQHHKQRRVIEKLIQFLVSLIQNRNQLVRKRRMKFMISPENLAAAAAAAAADDGNASSNAGSVSGAEASGETPGDILFNLTANQADEGLLQMGGIMADSEQNSAAGNPNHNHNHNNHHHHHHHPYYNLHHAPPTTTSEANNLDQDQGMEVDSIDEHQNNGKMEPGETVHVMHQNQNQQQQQRGQLVISETMSPNDIVRRASNSSMASVTAPSAGPNRHHQLFELGAATTATPGSPAEPVNSVACSSPSVSVYDRAGSSSSMLAARNAAGSRRSDTRNAIEDNDELVPNGATAASMSASAAQQYQLSTSGRSASTTPTSHNHPGGNNGHLRQAASMSQKLSRLGQENMIKVKGAPSPSVAAVQQQQQHHNHNNNHNQHHQLHQLHLHQQQQQQHVHQQQRLADLQQSDQRPSPQGGLSPHGNRLPPNTTTCGSNCYSSVPMLMRANGDSSSHQQQQQQHVFHSNQRLNMVANGHLQQQVHSGHHILQQQQQQHQQQHQHQLVHYGGSQSVANQPGFDHRQHQQQQHSINGLLASRRHHYNQNSHQQHQQLQARPASCHQQLSQWTANSIYNTMGQPDLASMTSGGGGGGPFAVGFSNMGGVFNELRVRPSFLSALGQRQQAAGSSGSAAASGASSSNNNEVDNGEGGSANPSAGSHNILGSLSANNNNNNSNQINGRLSSAGSNNSQTYY